MTRAVGDLAKLAPLAVNGLSGDYLDPDEKPLTDAEAIVALSEALRNGEMSVTYYGNRTEIRLDLKQYGDTPARLATWLRALMILER